MTLVTGQLKAETMFRRLFTDGLVPLSSFMPSIPVDGEPPCYFIDPCRLTARQIYSLANSLSGEQSLDSPSIEQSVGFVQMGIPVPCHHIEHLLKDGKLLVNLFDTESVLGKSPPLVVQVSATNAYSLALVLCMGLKHKALQDELTIGFKVGRFLVGRIRSELGSDFAERDLRGDPRDPLSFQLSAPDACAIVGVLQAGLCHSGLQKLKLVEVLDLGGDVANQIYGSLCSLSSDVTQYLDWSLDEILGVAPVEENR